MASEENNDQKKGAYYDFESPTKGDVEELLEKLSTMKRGADDKKKKMSYSISPSTQLLVKSLSEKSGATQGNIIDLAPFFFASVIEKSLKRREERLPLLEDIVRTVTGALSGITINAPHLDIYVKHVVAMITEILNMERTAIDTQDFHGVDSSEFKTISGITENEKTPAYYKEVEDYLEKDSKTEALFHMMYGDK